MAAELVGRQDVMKALEPTLKTQMRTWWDLISPDGYGYPWGRSLGAISYMDTMEIVGFLGERPQFRPAPMPQLASAYYLAWHWLSHDVLPDRHLLNVFGYGRGNYGYINKEREWQQTSAFLGKIAGAQYGFERSVKTEHLESMETQLQLTNVARFEYFRKGDRLFGVWLVRQPGVRFALPITAGTKPGTSDYLPAPYNFLNFAAPVERILPTITPFLELTDGRTIVASDGADQIEPSADGHSLHAVWKRWAVIGAKAGELVDPGIVTDVTWELKGTTLTRRETFSASKQVEVRRMWMIVPSTASVKSNQDSSTYEFQSSNGMTKVAFHASTGPVQTSLRATGNSPEGRGSQAAIPLILQIEQNNLSLMPGQPLTWTLAMTADSATESRKASE